MTNEDNTLGEPEVTERAEGSKNPSKSLTGDFGNGDSKPETSELRTSTATDLALPSVDAASLAPSLDGPVLGSSPRHASKQPPEAVNIDEGRSPSKEAGQEDGQNVLGEAGEDGSRPNSTPSRFNSQAELVQGEEGGGGDGAETEQEHEQVKDYAAKIREAQIELLEAIKHSILTTTPYPKNPRGKTPHREPYISPVKVKAEKEARERRAKRQAERDARLGIKRPASGGSKERPGSRREGRRGALVEDSASLMKGLVSTMGSLIKAPERIKFHVDVYSVGGMNAPRVLLEQDLYPGLQVRHLITNLEALHNVNCRGKILNLKKRKKTEDIGSKNQAGSPGSKTTFGSPGSCSGSPNSSNPSTKVSGGGRRLSKLLDVGFNMKVTLKSFISDLTWASGDELVLVKIAKKEKKGISFEDKGTDVDITDADHSTGDELGSSSKRRNSVDAPAGRLSISHGRRDSTDTRRNKEKQRRGSTDEEAADQAKAKDGTRPDYSTRNAEGKTDLRPVFLRRRDSIENITLKDIDEAEQKTIDAIDEEAADDILKEIISAGSFAVRNACNPNAKKILDSYVVVLDNIKGHVFNEDMSPEEAEINLDYARRLYPLIDYKGAGVIVTREFLKIQDKLIAFIEDWNLSVIVSNGGARMRTTNIFRETLATTSVAPVKGFVIGRSITLAKKDEEGAANEGMPGLLELSSTSVPAGSMMSRAEEIVRSTHVDSTVRPGTMDSGGIGSSAVGGSKLIGGIDENEESSSSKKGSNATQAKDLTASQDLSDSKDSTSSRTGSKDGEIESRVHIDPEAISQVDCITFETDDGEISIPVSRAIGYREIEASISFFSDRSARLRADGSISMDASALRNKGLAILHNFKASGNIMGNTIVVGGVVKRPSQDMSDCDESHCDSSGVASRGAAARDYTMNKLISTGLLQRINEIFESVFAIDKNTDGLIDFSELTDFIGLLRGYLGTKMLDEFMTYMMDIAAEERKIYDDRKSGNRGLSALITSAEIQDTARKNTSKAGKRISIRTMQGSKAKASASKGKGLGGSGKNPYAPSYLANQRRECQTIQQRIDSKRREAARKGSKEPRGPHDLYDSSEEGESSEAETVVVPVPTWKEVDKEARKRATNVVLQFEEKLNDIIKEITGSVEYLQECLTEHSVLFHEMGADANSGGPITAFGNGGKNGDSVSSPGSPSHGSPSQGNRPGSPSQGNRPESADSKRDFFKSQKSLAETARETDFGVGQSTTHLAKSGTSSFLGATGMFSGMSFAQKMSFSNMNTDGLLAKDGTKVVENRWIISLRKALGFIHDASGRRTVENIKHILHHYAAGRKTTKWRAYDIKMFLFRTAKKIGPLEEWLAQLKKAQKTHNMNGKVHIDDQIAVREIIEIFRFEYGPLLVKILNTAARKALEYVEEARIREENLRFEESGRSSMGSVGLVPESMVLGDPKQERKTVLPAKTTALKTQMSFAGIGGTQWGSRIDSAWGGNSFGGWGDATSTRQPGVTINASKSPVSHLAAVKMSNMSPKGGPIGGAEGTVVSLKGAVQGVSALTGLKKIGNVRNIAAQNSATEPGLMPTGHLPPAGSSMIEELERPDEAMQWMHEMAARTASKQKDAPAYITHADRIQNIAVTGVQSIQNQEGLFPVIRGVSKEQVTTDRYGAVLDVRLIPDLSYLQEFADTISPPSSPRKRKNPKLFLYPVHKGNSLKKIRENGILRPFSLEQPKWYKDWVPPLKAQDKKGNTRKSQNGGSGNGYKTPMPESMVTSATTSKAHSRAESRGVSDDEGNGKAASTKVSAASPRDDNGGSSSADGRNRSNSFGSSNGKNLLVHGTSSPVANGANTASSNNPSSSTSKSLSKTGSQVPSKIGSKEGRSASEAIGEHGEEVSVIGMEEMIPASPNSASPQGARRETPGRRRRPSARIASKDIKLDKKTKRKQKEDEIAEEKAALRKFIDQVPWPVSVKNLKPKFTPESFTDVDQLHCHLEPYDSTPLTITADYHLHHPHKYESDEEEKDREHEVSLQEGNAQQRFHNRMSQKTVNTGLFHTFQDRGTTVLTANARNLASDGLSAIATASLIPDEILRDSWRKLSHKERVGLVYQTRRAQIMGARWQNKLRNLVKHVVDEKLDPELDDDFPYFGRLIPGKVKELSRAAEKVVKKYNGDPFQLKDMHRAVVCCRSPVEMHSCVASLVPYVKYSKNGFYQKHWRYNLQLIKLVVELHGEIGEVELYGRNAFEARKIMNEFVPLELLQDIFELVILNPEEAKADRERERKRN